MTVRRIVRCAVEAVEARTLFAAPALDAIPAYSVPVGKTIQIPVTSTSNGGTVTYSVRDSSTSVRGGYHTKATFIQMNVRGYSEPMVFQLFGDVAPDTVRRITGLVNSKFYDGLTFHRIINDFAIQGGDPEGDGTGGAEFQFDDEFNANTTFTGTGQLAMANSGKDTNSSQFFVTEGPQRFLDFNHTIFGQLVRGEATRQAISNVNTNSTTGAPNTAVVIDSVRVVNDTSDNVLQMTASAAGTYTVKVTATNADGSTSRNFTLTAAADTINDPPILNTASVAPVYYTTVGKSVVLTPGSVDPEGNNSNFFVGRFEQQNGATGGFAGTNQNQITITPTAAGLTSITVGVIADQSASTRGSTNLAQNDSSGVSISDSETVRIAAGDLPISAAAYNLEVASGTASRGLLVGYYTDSDASGTAAQNAAQVDWGDGTVTSGTIQRTSRRGRFAVYADKTYAAKVSGTLPITLTVTGTLGAYSRATSTISVRQAASLSGNVLTLNGTSGSDKIGVDRKGSNYVVSVNGVNTTYPTSQVGTINAYGFAGSDRISLTARVFASTFLDGGDDNDALTGGVGANVISAGAGDDTVVCGNGTSSIANRVAGGAGNDTVTGGTGRDRIFGGDGNDSLSGGGGRDIVGGDAGLDVIVGNAGNDSLYGAAGRDTLNGQSGADLVDGGADRDTYKFDNLDSVLNAEVRV